MTHRKNQAKIFYVVKEPSYMLHSWHLRIICTVEQNTNALHKMQTNVRSAKQMTYIQYNEYQLG